MPTAELTERDIEIVTPLIDLFKSQARGALPLYGDAVEIWHPTKGKLYDRGHIEADMGYRPRREGWTSLCTQPYVPFCWSDKAHTRLTFEASGGYWMDISPEQLRRFEPIDWVTKTFWTWGHKGVGAHCGVYFEAPVMLWRYTDGRFY